MEGSTKLGRAFGKPERSAERLWVEVRAVLFTVMAMLLFAFGLYGWWALLPLSTLIGYYAGYGATHHVATGMGSFTQGFLVGLKIGVAATAVVYGAFVVTYFFQSQVLMFVSFSILGLTALVAAGFGMTFCLTPGAVVGAYLRKRVELQRAVPAPRKPPRSDSV